MLTTSIPVSSPLIKQKFSRNLLKMAFQEDLELLEKILEVLILRTNKKMAHPSMYKKREQVNYLILQLRDLYVRIKEKEEDRKAKGEISSKGLFTTIDGIDREGELIFRSLKRRCQFP